jgi:hypothetical protein
VKAQFRLVQPVDHVGEQILEAIPQIDGPAGERLADVRVDLLCDSCLLFS